MTDAEKIVKGFEALQTQRSAFDGTLRDITFYVMPEYESVERPTGDSAVANRPVSSAATDAAILLGGHLFSHTVNTGEQWFTLRPTSDEDDSGVKGWLDDAERTALKSIQNSNFNEAFGEACVLLGAYGTACMSVQWDDEREELVFRNHPIMGAIYLVEDHKGRVNGLYRLLRYTANQAASRYGQNNLPTEVAADLADPSQAAKQHEFIEFIGLNPDYNPESRGSRHMQYRSVHVYRKSEESQIMEESGFRTFPFVCPRFVKVRDWPYGYGAGHLALPAIRELNKAEADFIEAIKMEIWPPIWLPDEEAVETSEIRPSAVNYFDSSRGAPFQLKPTSSAGPLHQRIMQLEQRVERQFFIDMFLAVSARHGKEKTAYEVKEISEEKISSVGPMISRLQSECFAPLVERVVDILLDKGRIEQPPESARGAGFRVVYTSRIDSKLAAIEVGQTLRAISEVGQLAQMEAELPRVGRWINLDKTANGILERRNVEADHIISEQERRQIDEGQAQAAEEQQQQEMLQQQLGPVDPMKRPESGSMADALAQQVGEEQSDG